MKKILQQLLRRTCQKLYASIAKMQLESFGKRLKVNAYCQFNKNVFIRDYCNFNGMRILDGGKVTIGNLFSFWHRMYDDNTES